MSCLIPHLFGVHSFEADDEVDLVRRFVGVATDLDLLGADAAEFAYVEWVLVADGECGKAQRILHCYSNVDRHRYRQIVPHTILDLLVANNSLTSQHHKRNVPQVNSDNNTRNFFKQLIRFFNILMATWIHYTMARICLCIEHSLEPEIKKRCNRGYQSINLEQLDIFAFGVRRNEGPAEHFSSKLECTQLLRTRQVICWKYLMPVGESGYFRDLSNKSLHFLVVSRNLNYLS